jgi:VIT1/CCC1 family predicted Fe2+/Mn2+ transporter
MFTRSPQTSLFISIGVTLAALFVFGFIKGRYTGTKPIRSALQTALIGSAAAGAAFMIARAIS